MKARQLIERIRRIFWPYEKFSILFCHRPRVKKQNNVIKRVDPELLRYFYYKVYQDTCWFNSKHYMPSPGRTFDMMIMRQEIILKKLNSPNATHTGGLPTHILKKCASSLCSLVPIVIQRCFDVGLSPIAWKSTEVKGLNRIQEKYRQISLISLEVKKMEKTNTDANGPFLFKKHDYSPAWLPLGEIHYDKLISMSILLDETY
ncbi:hypothetical protein HHI36_002599 [Cryptolaemus montrouzieri]|uniref:Maturase K n=1 Tax=Cryptolaemus montrouzieri TaxID=559131 RepID=A0ABD2PB07_9CUCU